MEQANRLYEITRDTFVVEVAPLSKYEQRKLDGVCTRCGAEPAQEESSLGVRCHGYMKNAQRRSKRSKRAIWKRKKLCGQCGKKRRPGGKLCPACSVRFGATPRPLVQHYVEHDADPAVAGWKETIEQSPDGKLRARRRFAGQGKRGRQSGAQLDEQDLADARRCVLEGERGLAYYRTAEVQALPRIQRDEVRAEALAKLQRAQRWLADIIDRNSPKSRKAVDPSEDE